MTLSLLLTLAHPVGATQSALEAERAFAMDARDNGQWGAFGRWATADGILIGRSVVPAKAVAAALEAEGEPAYAIHWWPALSMTSCDGTRAFNMGPWYDPGSATHGEFHTVWALGEEGWRYLLDMGIETDAPVALGAAIESRPDCDALPAAIEPPVEFETGTARGASASSPDGSLKWEWRHGVWGDQDRPSRQLRVWAWTAEGYAIVHHAQQDISE